MSTDMNIGKVKITKEDSNGWYEVIIPKEDYHGIACIIINYTHYANQIYRDDKCKIQVGLCSGGIDDQRGDGKVSFLCHDISRLKILYKGGEMRDIRTNFCLVSAIDFYYFRFPCSGTWQVSFSIEIYPGKDNHLLQVFIKNRRKRVLVHKERLSIVDPEGVYHLQFSITQPFRARTSLQIITKIGNRLVTPERIIASIALLTASNVIQ